MRDGSVGSNASKPRPLGRSEERRVGKECRSRRTAYDQKKKRPRPPHMTRRRLGLFAGGRSRCTSLVYSKAAQDQQLRTEPCSLLFFFFKHKTAYEIS